RIDVVLHQELVGARLFDHGKKLIRLHLLEQTPRRQQILGGQQAPQTALEISAGLVKPCRFRVRFVLLVESRGVARPLAALQQTPCPPPIARGSRCFDRFPLPLLGCTPTGSESELCAALIAGCFPNRANEEHHVGVRGQLQLFGRRRARRRRRFGGGRRLRRTRLCTGRPAFFGGVRWLAFAPRPRPRLRPFLP